MKTPCRVGSIDPRSPSTLAFVSREKKKCSLNPSQGKQPLIKKKKKKNVSCELKFISTICLIITLRTRELLNNWWGGIFLWSCFYHSYSKWTKQRITSLINSVYYFKVHKVRKEMLIFWKKNLRIRVLFSIHVKNSLSSLIKRSI